MCVHIHRWKEVSQNTSYVIIPCVLLYSKQLKNLVDSDPLYQLHNPVMSYNLQLNGP